MAQLSTAPELEADRRRPMAPRQITWVLAVIVLALLGNREIVAYNFTLGYAAALATAPLWIGALLRRRAGVVLTLLVLASIGAGVWLTEFGAVEREVNRAVLFGGLSLLIGLLLTAGVVVWSIPIVGSRVVAVAYGLGMITGVSPTGLAADNLWKFGFSLPVVICLLGAVHSSTQPTTGRRRALELGIVGILAVTSAVSDARSFFGMLMLVFVLVAYQCLPRVRNIRASALRTLVTIVGVGVLIYNVGVNLALEGFLGESARTRSEAQIDLTGSLILGGRPEIAATAALFLDNPLGYGFGAQPNLADIRTAKEGMTVINYEPNNGYVENYMFGNQFELHSVLGDAWAGAGFAGIALAVLVVVLILRAVVFLMAQRAASALMLFFAVYGLWNFIFSPLWTAVTTLGLAVGFALEVRGRRRTSHHGSTRAQRGFGRGERPSVAAATSARYRSGA